ncbi:MAG: SAM-dependent chlorinase/fluorinase [Actinomycetota bacterium]|nr:SAM-dependent chlorinase/fluorinase [Actinomycetota bacterium]
MTTDGYTTISFLSDYGYKDEFVGVVKSVIGSLAPKAMVVDITHGIKPHDIRAGGLALARSAQYLTSGIILAVVDPGVGGERRAIAIEVNNGESIYVGPDNGLLAPAIAMEGDVTNAVELDNPKFHLPSLTSTFAGRDIFAPIAAHLCNGIELGDLGSPIPIPSLHPGLLPVSTREGDVIVAEILWRDHFGNLQLNVSEDDITDFGDHIILRIGDAVRTIKQVSTFEEIPESEIGLLVDSSGLLALAGNGRSAAEELRINEGQQIRIEDGTAPESHPTPIQLKRKA